MPLYATSPLVPFWHKPKAASEEEKLRFRLRGLTTTELLDVTASSVTTEDADGSPRLRYGSASMRTAIGAGLLGWEGFTTADGAEVAFPNNALQKVNLLGPLLAPEIFWEILGASNLSEDQRKN
jgi:hypothetical protein